MNISWITDVINNNGGNENFETITHIAVYNENQCRGIINLRNNHFKLTRNIEGDWNFNEFRDLVINPNNPILMDNGDINIDNINNVGLEEQKKFIELLKYKKISTFELPNDCLIIVTCSNLKKNKISEEVYSLLVHI